MTSAEQALWLERALRAHAAMRAQFFDRRRGLYRPRGALRPPRAAEHLWPVARALVATLDLAGAAGAREAGVEPEREIAAHLETLERYWDPPAYRSDPRGSWLGGDRYYDDNAWVGLALVELERLRPGSGLLPRAFELFRFAVAGWDERPEAPCPGGVFWVEQGAGAGRRNHDRNTVSNAPNAELGLHLADLGEGDPRWLVHHARSMYEWVRASLGEGPAGAGLFYDKIRGDGSLDRALWSYNQGSMAGAAVLLARLGDEPEPRLAEAERIARRALHHYGGALVLQPPAFNAILFRNLLLVGHAGRDPGLGAEILAALRGYAGELWSAADAHGLLRMAGRRPSLLDQSALVQVLALLAWAPGDLGRLA